MPKQERGERAMRIGKDHTGALADSRIVYVDGDAVPDVTAHPAFAGILASVSQLYDFAADPANETTCLAPETGRPALKNFMIPRSAAGLAARREAIAKRADLNHGWVGRAPMLPMSREGMPTATMISPSRWRWSGDSCPVMTCPARLARDNSGIPPKVIQIRRAKAGSSAPV